MSDLKLKAAVAFVASFEREMPLGPVEAEYIRTVLQALAELQGENERLRAERDDARSVAASEYAAWLRQTGRDVAGLPKRPVMVEGPSIFDADGALVADCSPGRPNDWEQGLVSASAIAAAINAYQPEAAAETKACSIEQITECVCGHVDTATKEFRDECKRLDGQLQNAVMFMRRLMRNVPLDCEAKKVAYDWLIREGLIGSPLRNEYTEAEPHTCSQQGWTQEPWMDGGPGIGYTHDINGHCSDEDESASLPLADYDRAIACVNSLAGRDPACVERYEKALREIERLIPDCGADSDSPTCKHCDDQVDACDNMIAIAQQALAGK